jgi:transcriptional regulator with XRE-family HTH domain
MRLGDNIVAKRSELKITQTELARIIGISSAHMSRLESSENTNPSANLLIALSRELSTSIDTLLLGNVPTDTPIEKRLAHIEQYLAAQGDFTTKSSDK